MTSGHDKPARGGLESKVREDERPLLQAVAGRQDSDLVELAKRLRGKHLEKISTDMLVTALRSRVDRWRTRRRWIAGSGQVSQATLITAVHEA